MTADEDFTDGAPARQGFYIARLADGRGQVARFFKPDTGAASPAWFA